MFDVDIYRWSDFESSNHIRGGFMKKISILLLSLLLSTFVFADDGTAVAPAADCVSKAEMQEIARDFTQFQAQAQKDYCYDDSHISALIQTLMYMRHTAFSPIMNPSQDELFTGRFAQSWYQYFQNLVSKVEIVSSCPKGVVAYVYGLFGGDTMYACPLALTSTFSALDRASVFMHEARHLDGFPHVTCSRGPRKGIQGACDSRIADGGSYAVTVETYAQLGKYALDVHPALKAYARASAVVYADEAFETPVKIGRSENLLVMNSDLDFYNLDLATGQAVKLGKSPYAGRIVRRAQHMILFPFDKSLKNEYLFSKDEGTISQNAGELFQEYNDQTPDQRANLVDLHVGTQFSARIYKTSVRFTCDPSSASTTDINFPAAQTASNLVYLTGYSREASSTFVQTVDGSVFEIGCANKKAFLKASTMQLDQKYATVHKLGTQVLGLTSGKQIYKLELNSNGPSRSQLLATDLGQIIEMTPFQTFDFYQAQ
jgi:hypothetical protein